MNDYDIYKLLVPKVAAPIYNEMHHSALYDVFISCTLDVWVRLELGGVQI